MAHSRPLVDLGFTQTRLPLGTHICQIYRDEEERDASLQQFLLAGLQAGECTACFSDHTTEADLDAFFGEHDVSLADAKERNAFSLAGTEETYFPDGRFDPDQMLGNLKAFHEHAEAASFPVARVIGEMNPRVGDFEGGTRLLEYESKVTLLLQDHPVTTVCQYSAAEFDGKTIMDVLQVHPMMVVRGSVVMNPFYVPPEEFLATI